MHPLDRPLHPLPTTPRRGAIPASFPIADLLDYGGEAWCEVRALCIRGDGHDPNFVPALVVRPAISWSWDLIKLLDTARDLKAGELPPSGIKTYLLPPTSPEVQAALRSLGLNIDGANRLLDGRLADDPMWDLGLDRWKAFSQDLIQEATEKLPKPRLAELRRMTPWAFFVPAVFDQARKWAGLVDLKLTQEQALLTIMTRLLHEGGPRGTGQSKNAPYKVPAPDLETDLFVTLHRLQAFGGLEDANAVFRHIAFNDRESWSKVWRRVKKRADSLQARIERWPFKTIAIPFPEEARGFEAALGRQVELEFLHEWLGRSPTAARLLILAGGDPSRLRLLDWTAATPPPTSAPPPSEA